MLAIDDIFDRARARPRAPRRGRPRGAHADHRRGARAPEPHERRRHRCRRRARRRGLRDLARRPGAAPRRARAPARRGAAQREGGARRARHARDRQDRPGGPRRGAGDDRHLRPRRRPLAPALRPHDRLRAPRATACSRPGIRSGRSRSSRAFNFPVAVWSWNSALALVCGDPVVWKPSERTPLTALACQALLPARGRRLRRCARRAARGRDRRRRPRAPAGRGSAPAARLGDGLDGHGQGALAARRRPPRAPAARARRQQRDDRRAERRPRPGRARRRLQRRRHRGPALHERCAG